MPRFGNSVLVHVIPPSLVCSTADELPVPSPNINCCGVAGFIAKLDVSNPPVATSGKTHGAGLQLTVARLVCNTRDCAHNVIDIRRSENVEKIRRVRSFTEEPPIHCFLQGPRVVAAMQSEKSRYFPSFKYTTRF